MDKGKFYLGRVYDIEKKAVTSQPVLYDADDLTTHAVVVGMTGSGKTGLCIGMLEEAALNNIPALMIDPKGDITNTLLHFPDLLPSDFRPWVDPDQARRAGMSLDEAAAQAAGHWQKGLAEWGIGRDRLQALQRSAQFAVYTPGSDAGIPVSILASLKAPALDWESNRELLREKIASTVTALLGLIGLSDIDPVRSREHILLSNIFEYAWSRGKDLDLGELILQTQSPPFPKLGVFDVNTFFPEKDRFSLAMMLNNILAAPSFQAWIEGQPLDIPSLLWAPDGRPRHSVFYIAHLGEAERMFFVTLLYSAVESWMRSQAGTSSLRTILYFDEIFGYLPPLGNPPSKQPILRMLKQARAFGVGQVLVTQNPVDVDYKALSNAGTWYIGKLQTEQDKQRLLDGLQGAMAGSLDRGHYDRLISSLAKRVFLLHNVHEKAPALFQTRWAMNFLAGPLTRTQIPALNQLAGAALAGQPSLADAGSLAFEQAGTRSPEPARLAPEPARGRAETPAPQAAAFSTTRPSVPVGVSEYFLPMNLSFTAAFKAAGRSYPDEAMSQGVVYRPVLLAQSNVRFLNRKYNLDHELVRAAIVAAPDRRGVVRWDNFDTDKIDPALLDDQPDPRARYATLEAPLNDSRLLSALQKDYADWAYRTSQVTVRAHEGLKVYAGPEVTSGEFRTLVTEAARQQRDAEVQKAEAQYDKKIDAINDKLAREERELAEDQTELSQRKMEEMGTHAENVFGLFTGRKSSRRISSSLSKRRLTEQAKADVDESIDAIADLKKQIQAQEKEKFQVIEEINRKWGELINEISEIQITPFKKDVQIDLFGVAWAPYYQVQIGEQVEELPAYSL